MGRILLVMALITGVLGFAVYQLGAGGRLAAELNRSHDAEVILYSASWCSACAATRQFLNQSGQPFVELDMEDDPAAAREFAQFGGHGIPLVLVKGSVIRGHQPQVLSQALR
ncbi:Glutaredoxin [Ferrimonas sediminum]|uniref:Glutaredoxin n=1 Tax=Ferrimonas sediminum TaxID=718193 RepID=A0A1G8XEL6_9GAMM|nr:glutaredoxin family protein [Ferrimonas sediminum]SDJ89018.1 Glutaredoxin [Ferrimonas sediminum]